MRNNHTRSPGKLRDKVTETRENIADMGHLAKTAVQDKLHDLKERAAETFEAGKEKMHAMEEAFGKRVSESPMKAVLVAAGVGLVLGWLWRRA